MFVNGLASDPATYNQFNGLHQRMKKLRDKIEPARHKLAAHADRDAIRAGKPLGHASFEEWQEFWSALKDFVRILNEKMTGKRFDSDAGGALADAGSLLKALKQSQHFKTLLEGDDQAVADACRELEE
jgi:hypothetical protein